MILIKVSEDFQNKKNVAIFIGDKQIVFDKKHKFLNDDGKMVIQIKEPFDWETDEGVCVQMINKFHFLNKYLVNA